MLATTISPAVRLRIGVFSIFQTTIRHSSGPTPLRYRYCVLFSVKPSPARMGFLENILKFNRLVDDFLQTQPETEYIDVCSDMLGQDRKPIPVFVCE